MGLNLIKKKKKKMKNKFLTNFILSFNFFSLFHFNTNYAFLENKFFYLSLFFSCTTFYLFYKLNNFEIDYLKLDYTKLDYNLLNYDLINYSKLNFNKLNYLDLVNFFAKKENLDLNLILNQKIQFLTNFKNLYSYIDKIVNSNKFQEMAKLDFLDYIEKNKAIKSYANLSETGRLEYVRNHIKKCYATILDEISYNSTTFENLNTKNNLNLQTLTVLKENLDLNSGLIFQNPEQISVMFQSLLLFN